MEQVRTRLGCSKSHVYRLINQAVLPAVRIGARMGLRVSESSVRQFLDDNQVTEDLDIPFEDEYWDN